MTLELRAEVDARDAVLELDLRDGETLAVLGPNGAGKSTLLDVVAGLVRPDRGRAVLDGEILFDTAARVSMPAHRRRIALLDQRASLFPHLGVRGNVLFGARAAGRAGAAERAERWLTEVDAAELSARPSTDLSGGQAQRVALARALAAEPRVVLLDEPMASLDVEVTPSLRRMLRRVLADRSAVIVTHDVLDAWMLADRVAVVEGGRVVASGATAEVLANPATRFLAELTGLGLIRGVRTPTGIRTVDGRELPAPDDELPTGSGVRAAVDPAAIALVADGGIPARVLAMDPRGSRTRLRTDLVPVDIATADAARLVEGDEVHLAVPASAVRLRAD